jgi:hypothetical protein
MEKQKMKVRISKNLKGRIVIPILSHRSIEANTTFEITEEHFWSKDIQQAISKRLLVVEGVQPKSVVVEGVQPKSVTTMKKITNVSKTAVSLPGLGLLKPRQSVSVDEELLMTENFRRLLDKRILREEGKASPAKAEKAKKEEVIDSPVNDWKAVIIDPNEEGESRTKSVEPRTRNGKKPTVKNKTGALKTGDESIIIDPRAKSVEEDDDEDREDTDVIFVDREQQKERIKKHPVLSKKAKGKKSE